MDGRHRAWVATSHGILVVDRLGNVLADYPPGSLPGIDGEATVMAASAGPATLPVPQCASTANGGTCDIGEMERCVPYGP